MVPFFLLLFVFQYCIFGTLVSSRIKTCEFLVDRFYSIRSKGVSVPMCIMENSEVFLEPSSTILPYPSAPPPLPYHPSPPPQLFLLPPNIMIYFTQSILSIFIRLMLDVFQRRLVTDGFYQFVLHLHLWIHFAIHCTFLTRRQQIT